MAVSIAGAPVMFVGAVRERLGGRGLRKGDVKVRGLRDLCDLAELCDLHPRREAGGAGEGRGVGASAGVSGGLRAVHGLGCAVIPVRAR